MRKLLRQLRVCTKLIGKRSSRPLRLKSVIFTDDAVTERKRATQALRESEEQVCLLLNHYGIRNVIVVPLLWRSGSWL